MANISWIGQTLNNRYQIEALLGQGGMSSVYKATDPNLRRTVAVKMIHSHLSSDPTFVHRFEEEAAIVAQLRHENIVQVYDFNHDNDVYYMVLEFIPGETLEERLKRLNDQKRRMDMAEAVKFITQICDALGYAHGHGMIHRDVKPANIMLDIYGRAILMDFGVSRMVGGRMHTAAGAVVGTATYMSPEQIKGEQVDGRTDLYSLGVTLFETISGKPPYKADTAMTLMMMHLNDPLPDIREIHTGVPDGLVQVISKAMAKDRQARYQTAEEMGADLRSLYTCLTEVRPATAIEDSPLGTATRVEPPLVNQAQAEIPDISAESTRVEKQISAPWGVKPGIPITSPGQAQVSPKAASTRPVVNPGGKTVPGTPSTHPPDVAPVDPQNPPRAARPSVVPFFIGGGAVLAIIGLAVVMILAVSGLLRGPTEQPRATATSLSGLAGFVTPTATATDTAVATSEPTQILAAVAATSADQSGPQGTPVPADYPYVRIKGISVENGRYVVDYETLAFTEQLSGMSIHFFFNNVPPDQAGSPGKGPWMVYGGPRPFRGYAISNRPPGATQICALVANPDSTIQPDSGNCFNLP